MQNLSFLLSSLIISHLGPQNTKYMHSKSLTPTQKSMPKYFY